MQKEIGGGGRGGRKGKENERKGIRMGGKRGEMGEKVSSPAAIITMCGQTNGTATVKLN